MGISAIFKRLKPAAPNPEATPDAADPRRAPRHIRRRERSSVPHPSAKGSTRPDRSSKSQQPDPTTSSHGNVSGNASRKILPSSASHAPVNNFEPPTPTDSGDDTPLAYISATGGGRKNNRTLPTASRQRKSQPDSAIFGIPRLTTPPLDKHSPELGDLDPFEVSPPRRPLTSFEDPVYIPPLTLASTLVDEYGIADASLGNNNPTHLPSPTATAVATPATLSAATRSSCDPGTAGAERASAQSPKHRDFLSEFNATYSYIFGSPPSETVLQSQSPQKAQDCGLSSEDKPKADAANEGEDYETAMGSDDGSSTDEDDESSVHDKVLEEERRKEEERKAAELRSRRREMIKQQVAFERMKERHRRQFPGQQTPSGPHGSVTRWQRESARAAGAIPSMQFSQGVTRSQGALHASNSTVNRGGLASGIPQSPTQHQFGGCMVGGQRGDISSVAIPGCLLHTGVHANSSMPNMAAYSLQLQAQQQHHQQQHISQIREGIHAGVPMPQGSQSQVSNTSCDPVAIISPHPVKLANASKRTKNLYQSDSSDDGDDTISSSSSSDLTNGDSDVGDDMLSIGSSDISCDYVPHVSPHAASLPPRSSIDGGAATVSHKATSSDSSSDASAKSQTSSKRRVRFHETVSVVFSTRPSVTGKDAGCEAHESDSNSSDASVGLRISYRNSPRQADPQNTVLLSKTHSNARTTKASADDAFDGDDAMNHARYNIPACSPQARKSGSALWLDGDATTVNSSKSTSVVSSRNISPDGTKGHGKSSTQRFETEPLRDREAEREQQERKRQQRNKDGVKYDNVYCSEAGLNSPEESDHTARATIAKADMTTTTTSTPQPGATEPAKQAIIDHVDEARRALLGHYHSPSSLVPVGAGIPRSVGTKPAYTSSVRVLGPQSFSRPKKSYSKSTSATPSEKPADNSKSHHKKGNFTVLRGIL